MPGGFIRNSAGPHLCSTSPPGPSPHPGPCRAPGVNLCPVLALAAGTAGWPLGHLPRALLGCLPHGKWSMDFGAGTCEWVPSNCLAGLARTDSIGAVGVGAPVWPAPASQAPRPTARPASASGSGCLDTQAQVRLLTHRLPLPGTSQWPRPGAPGALSPSYDGGLHSLVSFLPQPSGAGGWLSLVGTCGRGGGAPLTGVPGVGGMVHVGTIFTWTLGWGRWPRRAAQHVCCGRFTGLGNGVPQELLGLP